MPYDVVVIGAGVVGCAIARELARYELAVAVVDKEADVAFGSTKANSGIVHAGFHSAPGSLKARLGVRGSRLYPGLAAELDVRFQTNGSLMVARHEGERAALREFLAQGKRNGVAGLELVDREALTRLEPNLSPDLAGALHAPTGGIVSPFDLAIALAENARENGVRFLLSSPVTAVERRGGEFILTAGREALRAAYVVNAAGLHAARVAALIHDDSFSVKPRKGEEYLLDRRLAGFVTRTVYPLPSANSKGILLIPTVDGNLMLGPTAVEVERLDDSATTSAGWREIYDHVSILAPAITAQDLISSFAGLRAAAPGGDFVIGPSPADRRWLNVAGIDSPGLTAAPAIAEHVAAVLGELGVRLEAKHSFRPERRVIRFRLLSPSEQDRLIAQDPRYGGIVCRCELVTEAEVVRAVAAGATTLDGVKFRTRAGMGRCQGGFCSPRVIQILARELGADPVAITKRGAGSELLRGRTRRPADRRAAGQ